MTSRSDVIDLPASGRMSRSGARLVLAARALRAIADGFVAVLLPAYLLALGHSQLEVGFLSTATLVGSAIATLAVGRWGHRFALRRLLLAAAVLMVATGLGFATITSLWPLLVVAFMGPLNPTGGDVSVFLPLEHTVLAASASTEVRTSVFARYSFVGSIFGAVGALAAAVPDWLASERRLADARRAAGHVRGVRGPRRRSLGALPAHASAAANRRRARRRPRSGRRAASS